MLSIARRGDKAITSGKYPELRSWSKAREYIGPNCFSATRAFSGKEPAFEESAFEEFDVDIPYVHAREDDSDEGDDSGTSSTPSDAYDGIVDGRALNSDDDVQFSSSHLHPGRVRSQGPRYPALQSNVMKMTVAYGEEYNEDDSPVSSKTKYSYPPPMPRAERGNPASQQHKIQYAPAGQVFPYRQPQQRHTPQYHHQQWQRDSGPPQPSWAGPPTPIKVPKAVGGARL
ncbi:hypothetical protein PG984_002961 [Apiospora sp. TS-2023a]